jgi:hypothetical protein
VLLAVLAGAELLGITGVLLALPPHCRRASTSATYSRSAESR